VLKRRLQRGERQLKQLLFGRIVMGWMGETDVSGIGSSASQTVRDYEGQFKG
jgi:hypothetical protein